MDEDKKGSVERRDSLKVRSRGELIAALRRNLGYSQEELEWRSGVSKTQISRIERDLSNPSIDTIRKLEAALDVPLMDLFINPSGTGQEDLQVKQPGTVLNEFEKKLAQEQLSAKELQSVLSKALDEVGRKKALRAAKAAAETKTAAEQNQDSDCRGEENLVPKNNS